MYSKNIVARYENWLEKAMDDRKEFFLLKTTGSCMISKMGKSLECVLSLGLSMHMEDGSVKTLSYDISHGPDKPIEGFSLIMKDREKMILRLDDDTIQGFGFRTPDNKRDPMMNHGAVTNLFLYYRTARFHTFLFASRDEEGYMQAVKLLEEFAPVDAMNRAIPDAITSWMAFDFRKTPDGKEGMESHDESSAV